MKRFFTPTLSPDYVRLDPKIAPLVRAINQMGLPTVYSSQGHEEKKEGGFSFPYPIVGIAPDLAREQGPRLCVLMELLGFYNSNCHAATDVEWVIRSIGNPSLVLELMPLEPSRPLVELQRGILVFAHNLAMMEVWY